MFLDAKVWEGYSHELFASFLLRRPSDNGAPRFHWLAAYGKPASASCVRVSLLRDAVSRASSLLIADSADAPNPDSRARAMLFLIPDCVARAMPDSRSRAMSFSFPDHAKSLIPDSRPSPMSFSIPDSAGAPFPDVVPVDRARKSPAVTGLGDTRYRGIAENYWRLAVLFTAPRSSRCSSPDARLPDFSSGCFSKTT